jgi:glucose-6-phosphate isomerase
VPGRAFPHGLRLLMFNILALETFCHVISMLPVTPVAPVNLALGPLDQQVRSAAPGAERAAAALAGKDPSLWSSAPEVQKKIANRLGWLDSPRLMAKSVERLTSFAAGIKAAGFTDIVLLGMGGSSLAPEVLRAIVGVAPGWPRFHMLDSTDPAAVQAAATSPAKTLYILASKSGGTIEPNSLAAHFRATLEAAGIRSWADHFIAITDEGTDLAKRARDERFREVFINPSDIGGRYSALSFFGMVPSALMGQDLPQLIAGAITMVDAALAPSSAIDNPAVGLGLVMAEAAKAGRDKLTLLLPDAFKSFGLWVEQLVAESTGKGGTGVVPIAGEPAGPPAVYGEDRLFVDLRGGSPATLGPAVTFSWKDPLSLGAEFVRWEIATAIAGALLGINPFDEPNVQQAKDATSTLLAAFKSTGALPSTAPDATLAGGVELTATRAAKAVLAGRDATAVLALLEPGDYFAQLAYVSPASDLLPEFERLRTAARDRARVATTLGVGPRYLHSTGQLHKGGPNTGVFLLITTGAAADVEIPGQPYTFRTLERAQALGDFASLDAANRRAVHVHLPAPDPALARDVVDAFIRALSS